MEQSDGFFGSTRRVIQKNDHKFKSWLQCFTGVRNKCAHYDRLYNSGLTSSPALYKADRKRRINPNTLFAAICCMRYFLRTDLQWEGFVLDLKDLIYDENYPHVRPSVMGFIDGWEDILLDQL